MTGRIYVKKGNNIYKEHFCFSSIEFQDSPICCNLLKIKWNIIIITLWYMVYLSVKETCI